MLKKQYVKSRKVAKITFALAKDEIPQDVAVETLHLVGEFNDWDPGATPMKRVNGGGYMAVLELAPGREFKYRFLINGEHWCNDWGADAYTPSGFGEDNCVVVTPASA